MDTFLSRDLKQKDNVNVCARLRVLTVHPLCHTHVEHTAVLQRMHMQPVFTERPFVSCCLCLHVCACVLHCFAVVCAPSYSLSFIKELIRVWGPSPLCVSVRGCFGRQFSSITTRSSDLIPLLSHRDWMQYHYKENENITILRWSRC